RCGFASTNPTTSSRTYSSTAGSPNSPPIATRAYDYGRKFELYRILPSMDEYVLIAQDRLASKCSAKRRKYSGFFPPTKVWKRHRIGKASPPNCRSGKSTIGVFSLFTIENSR